MEKQPAALRYFKRLSSAVIEVLRHHGTGPLEGTCATEHRRSLFLRDELCRVARRLHLGPAGEIVIHPDIHCIRRGRGRLRRGGVEVVDGGHEIVGSALFRGHTRVQLGDPAVEVGRSDLDDRLRQQRVAIHRGVRVVVEEGVERVELLRGDRVELVIVTHGAVDREPHPRAGHRAGAVDGVAEEEFLVDCAALAGRHIAAVEARGGKLFHGGAG